MSLTRENLKTYRNMHCTNFAQSKAIDRWVKIAKNGVREDSDYVKFVPPMFKHVPGTPFNYDRVIRKWYSMRQSAHRRGIAFALIPTSLMNIMRAKKCYYSGVELTPGAKPGKKHNFSDFTVDRIDADVGYVAGNVVACCRAVNQMKSFIEARGETPTPEQMKKIIAAARKGEYTCE
jgi:hypothetical protein